MKIMILKGQKEKIFSRIEIFCFGVQCLIKIKQFLDKVFLLNKMKSLIEKLEKCFSVFMKES